MKHLACPIMHKVIIFGFLPLERSMKHALTFACVLIASVVCTGPLRGQDAPNAEDARSHELLPDQERQFSKLAVKFKVDSAAFWAEFKEAKASDDESEDALFREKYPPNSMVDEFLELESKSRSTHVGFSCLYHLLAVETWCFAAPEWAVTKGKQQALLILGEHYHSYPDVDTTFRLLFSGAQIAESDAFLRELIANSRLDYVKANAMFALADNLATESNLPAFIESSVSVLDANVPEQKDTLAHFDRFAALLRIVDDKKCRDEAIVLLERLSQDYPNILEPPRAETRTPALIQVARTEFDAILTRTESQLSTGSHRSSLNCSTVLAVKLLTSIKTMYSTSPCDCPSIAETSSY